MDKIEELRSGVEKFPGVREARVYRKEKGLVFLLVLEGRHVPVFMNVPAADVKEPAAMTLLMLHDVFMRSQPIPEQDGLFPEFSKELRARAQERAKELLWGAPTDDPRVLALRLTFKDAAAAVFLAAPEGRRRAVAMTHLEEALMWATKAVYEQE